MPFSYTYRNDGQTLIKLVHSDSANGLAVYDRVDVSGTPLECLGHLQNQFHKPLQNVLQKPTKELGEIQVQLQQIPGPVVQSQLKSQTMCRRCRHRPAHVQSDESICIMRTENRLRRITREQNKHVFIRGLVPHNQVRFCSLHATKYHQNQYHMQKTLDSHSYVNNPPLRHCSSSSSISLLFENQA